MHIIRSSILCFVMLSVIAVQNATSQSYTNQFPNDTNQQQVTPASEIQPSTADNAYAPPAAAQPVKKAPEQPVVPQKQQSESATGNSLLRMGIGFQCAVRFHQPEEFNDYITDIWNSVLDNTVYTPVDEKHIGPGVLLTLNGTFDIGPLFSAAPFMQGMWAGQQFYFSGDQVMNIHINTYTAMGGLNLWVRVIDNDAFALRLGTGFYGAHTISRVTGDACKTVFSGNGYGFRELIGTELQLTSAITLTLDCGVTFGKIGFDDQKDKITKTGYAIRYPGELDQFGFELSPGIMFYF